MSFTAQTRLPPVKKPGVPNVRTLGVEETLKLLVTSLATPWDRLQLKNVQTEQELLENFAQLHASAYVYSGEPHGQLYRIILRALMANRLLVVGFPENSPPHLYLGAVQCLRLILRDSRLMAEFGSTEGFSFLASQLKALTFEHFGGGDETAMFTTELLVEYGSIVKKLATDRRFFPRVVKLGLHATLAQLLYSRDSAILPIVLVSLTGLARDGKLADQLSTSDTVEILIRMVDEYGPSLRMAAADLLNLLCRSRRGRSRLLQLEGCSVLLQQLHSATPELISASCKILHSVSAEPGGVQQIRQVGGIPIVANLLRALWQQTVPREMEPAGRHEGIEGAEVPCPLLSNDERTFQLTAVCAILTRLSEDADCAVQIAKCNAIYWLGRLVSDSLELSWAQLPDAASVPDAPIAGPVLDVSMTGGIEGEAVDAGPAADGQDHDAFLISPRPVKGGQGWGSKAGPGPHPPVGRRNSGRNGAGKGPGDGAPAAAAAAGANFRANRSRSGSSGAANSHAAPPAATDGDRDRDVQSAASPPADAERAPPLLPSRDGTAEASTSGADDPPPPARTHGGSYGAGRLERRSSLVHRIRALPNHGEDSEAGGDPHPPPAPPPAQVLSNPALERLWLMAIRGLRFLFSLERNRKLFKSLFPAEVFFDFIDVGHYEHDMEGYRPLVAAFRALGAPGGRVLRQALEEINTESLAQDGRRLRGYVLLEILGRGAFGCVYKAKRLKGETLVAVKEVPLDEAGVMLGATEEERKEGAGQLCSEVAILSQMQHPNIVKYYESFMEAGNIYIVMELMEGVSLMDHINRHREMATWMPEEDIWAVVISLVMAMNYMHTARGVVHRDLTPNNVVLGQGADALRRAKLTDFGLARQKRTPSNGSIILQSMVGTMAYACPEIIQGEPHSEKADIWSLGCVVYHCMMRRPPFEGSNPLAVATRIVEGNIDPIDDPPSASGAQPYTSSLKALVLRLLTPDPAARPSIQEVASLVAGRVLLALDKSVALEDELQRALEYEKQRRKHSYVLYTQKKEIFRRLLMEVQAKADDRAMALAATGTLPGQTPRDLSSAGGPSSNSPMDHGPPSSQGPTMTIALPHQASSPHQAAALPPGVAPSDLLLSNLQFGQAGLHQAGPNASQRSSRNQLGLIISVPPGTESAAGTIQPFAPGAGGASPGSESVNASLSAPNLSGRPPPYIPSAPDGPVGTHHGEGAASTSFSFLDTSGISPALNHQGGNPNDVSALMFDPSRSPLHTAQGQGAGALPDIPSLAIRSPLSTPHTARGGGSGTDGEDSAKSGGGIQFSQMSVSPHNGTWPLAQGSGSFTARGATAPIQAAILQAIGQGGAVPFNPNSTQPVSSARSRAPARTIAIASERLKPISDPVAEVLQLVLKLRYVENAPPGSVARDWRHRCIQRFTRAVFAPINSAGQIKTDLARLAAGSPEIVDIDFGRTGGARGSRPNSSNRPGRNSEGRGQGQDGEPSAPGDYRLSYEMLLGVLEDVCEEMGFYTTVVKRPSSSLFDDIDISALAGGLGGLGGLAP